MEERATEPVSRLGTLLILRAIATLSHQVHFMDFSLLVCWKCFIGFNQAFKLALCQGSVMQLYLPKSMEQLPGLVEIARDSTISIGVHQTLV